MSAPLGELNPDQFLAGYWQKKPCLIRQAFPGFTPDFDGDDLAGLACEETAEARIVSGTMEAGDWKVTHGPFDESVFAQLPEQNWTLLVQDVEKHYPPLQDLMRRFSFIPGWRLDDLMISYAAEGGSVGPHSDQYDVFLLQAAGRRRWQIAVDFNPEPLHGCELDVLQSFTPEQEWVLRPGDMLYLPPGVAHHGVALDAGMTWSIGARAPSAADLLQGLGEWLAFSVAGDDRYADPDLVPPKRAGEMDANALARLRHLLRLQLEREELDPFLAGYMSCFRMAQAPAPLEAPMDPGMLVQALGAGTTLQRDPWTRLLWVKKDGDALLFACGQGIRCSIHLAEMLCESASLVIDVESLTAQDLATLTTLVNNGHLTLGN